MRGFAWGQELVIWGAGGDVGVQARKLRGDHMKWSAFTLDPSDESLVGTVKIPVAAGGGRTGL